MSREMASNLRALLTASISILIMMASEKDCHGLLRDQIMGGWRLIAMGIALSTMAWSYSATTQPKPNPPPGVERNGFSLWLNSTNRQTAETAMESSTGTMPFFPKLRLVAGFKSQRHLRTKRTAHLKVSWSEINLNSITKNQNEPTATENRFRYRAKVKDTKECSTRSVGLGRLLS